MIRINEAAARAREAARAEVARAAAQEATVQAAQKATRAKEALTQFGSQ